MKRERLCFSTLGCPDWDFETVVRSAAEMGFSAVEIRGIREELSIPKLEFLQPDRLEESRRLLREQGITICGLNTSCMFHDPAEWESAVSEGKAAVDTCHASGVGRIRVFGNSIPEDREPGPVIRRVAEGIGAVCRHAESLGGIQVLLEIHGDFNRTETVAPLLELLSDHPSFGILWDIEQSFQAYGKEFRDFYRLIAPYVRHVHVKDCRADGQKRRNVPVGEGEINIREIVCALEQDGYSGYYSMEWEKRWEPELAEPEEIFPGFVAYMKEL